MQITKSVDLVSHPQQISRRSLIGGAIGVAAASAIPAPLSAALMGENRLAFRNTHTNERCDVMFARGGQLVNSGCRELDHLLRDWRTGETLAMDRKLFVLLTQLRDRLGVAPYKPFELISGYRSPHTNAALRQRGGRGTGVASTSQHMVGKATDIRMPGVSLDRLRDAAMSLRAGGVGYYPQDGFVHVDTGRVRHW